MYGLIRKPVVVDEGQETPEPQLAISVAEAKAQCRVSHSQDDSWFEAAIQAATRALESAYGWTYCVQTWELTLDGFSAGPIDLPMGAPLRDVNSIVYLTGAGETAELDEEAYVVDTASTPGRVYPAYNASWPPTLGYYGAVTIEYEAGYPDGEVPFEVRQAIAMYVATLYGQREHLTDKALSRVPDAIDLLLGPTRIIPV